MCLFSMIIPIFRIFDVDKANEFYLHFLGFQLDWDHRFEENLPLYYQISLEDAVLHLSEHHGDSTPGSAIRIKVNGLKEYHHSLARKNYSYAKPGLETSPWNTREMTVIDPFGNRITFYEDME